METGIVRSPCGEDFSGRAEGGHHHLVTAAALPPAVTRRYRQRVRVPAGGRDGVLVSRLDDQGVPRLQVQVLEVGERHVPGEDRELFTARAERVAGPDGTRLHGTRHGVGAWIGAHEICNCPAISTGISGLSVMRTYT